MPSFYSSSHDEAVAAKLAALDGKKPASSASGGPTMIEISPGVTARLRGADETFQAIEQDFYLPVLCMCCQLILLCALVPS